ncbi:FkbM family methyltransferase [Seonamhaeicola sp. ML3]|uniref:FkbM family methyltransferase n=1 Tax=Seonamhaeicola sp. ML3 TaxID=2937786 RepID=UPI00200E91EA|nr:FkbM family methyltransferase [Seonamhaeicola sp. ML3]
MFLHKGYWYYGTRREKDTIALFKDILPECSFVIDIGANIGYFSQYFFELMKSPKTLLLFEPENKNLTYLRKNIDKHNSVRIIEKAVSNKSGTANFYVDDLTGQNNSLLSDYKVFDEVVKNSGIKNVKKTKIEVQTITIDSLLEEEFKSKQPDFIKIDIEGAELLALKGMQKTIKLHHPTLMVEITENISETLQFIHDFGYVIFTPKKRLVAESDYKNVFFNVFCIHNSKHDLLNKLGIEHNEFSTLES